MLKAIVFDVDGVIAGTESIHYKAFQRVFYPYNINMSSDYHRNLVGYSVRDNIIKIKNDFRIDVDIERYIKLRNDEYASLLDRVVLEPNPGLQEILTWAKEQNIPMGICSSSKKNLAEKVLYSVFEHMGIEEPVYNFFDVIVTGDDGGRRKPYPDLYIETVKRLGQETFECLAIEDTQCGITSAVSAGLKTVGLLTPFNSMDDLMEADKIVSSLREIMRDNFWGWFSK